jgi:bifunctional DNA-binding transcriptional regulator/antitoxin component of YhaV-PrlF toxin-antitoxin module
MEYNIGDLVECSVFGAAGVGVVIKKYGDKDDARELRVWWHDGFKGWESASRLKLVAKAKNGI